LKLLWQHHAKIELSEALKYYRDQAGLDIARNFNQAAMRAARRLIKFPEIGVKAGHGIRRFVLQDYPYTLIYRATPEAVIIVAIAHQSRRPGYWQGRR
jgi:plasmid stabilization system protein ParE